jgi:hypothetical protein
MKGSHLSDCCDLTSKFPVKNKNADWGIALRIIFTRYILFQISEKFSALMIVVLRDFHILQGKSRGVLFTSLRLYPSQIILGLYNAIRSFVVTQNAAVHIEQFDTFREITYFSFHSTLHFSRWSHMFVGIFSDWLYSLWSMLLCKFYSFIYKNYVLFSHSKKLFKFQ